MAGTATSRITADLECESIDTAEQSESESNSVCKTPPKETVTRKPVKRRHSQTKFNREWTNKHPCIQRGTDDGKAACTVCITTFSIHHQVQR